MFKKISIILLLPFFIAPVFISAQTAPVLPNIIDVGQVITESIPAPISGFIDKLKNINIGDQSSILGDSGSINLSNVKSSWNSINNWFFQNIGISFTEIVKSIANLVIWVWEIIIKLIKVGLSYL